MPTVHLSLPESVYRELKKYANHLGVQVTDLIKMFINKGLEEYREKYSVPDRTEELITTINTVVKALEKIDKRLKYLELRIRENEVKLKEFIDDVESRINDLELTIQEIQEPVLEPEIINARPRKQRI